MSGVRWLLLWFWEPHATIPKQPNVGGHGVASEKVRTMKKNATQEELFTDWEVTMQDGCSVAVEFAPRPSTTGTWAHRRELQEALRICRKRYFQIDGISQR